MTHPIHTLNALWHMDIVERSENIDDGKMNVFSIKIPVDCYFEQVDLQFLKETFKADTVSVHYYIGDSDEPTVTVDLNYKADLLGICT